MSFSVCGVDKFAGWSRFFIDRLFPLSVVDHKTGTTFSDVLLARSISVNVEVYVANVVDSLESRVFLSLLAIVLGCVSEDNFEVIGPFVIIAPRLRVSERLSFSVKIVQDGLLIGTGLLPAFVFSSRVGLNYNCLGGGSKGQSWWSDGRARDRWCSRY